MNSKDHNALKSSRTTENLKTHESFVDSLSESYGFSWEEKYPPLEITPFERRIIKVKRSLKMALYQAFPFIRPQEALSHAISILNIDGVKEALKSGELLSGSAFHSKEAQFTSPLSRILMSEGSSSAYILKLMLESGLNPNTVWVPSGRKDTNSNHFFDHPQSLLNAFLRDGRWDCAFLLIEYGASLKQKNGHVSPLEAAFLKLNMNSLSFSGSDRFAVEQLIEKIGAEEVKRQCNTPVKDVFWGFAALKKRDMVAQKNTLLNRACSSMWSAIGFLMKAGADPNQVNKDGETPLEVLIERSSTYYASTDSSYSLAQGEFLSLLKATKGVTHKKSNGCDALALMCVKRYPHGLFEKIGPEAWRDGIFELMKRGCDQGAVILKKPLKEHLNPEEREYFEAAFSMWEASELDKEFRQRQAVAHNLAQLDLQRQASVAQAKEMSLSKGKGSGSKRAKTEVNVGQPETQKASVSSEAVGAINRSALNASKSTLPAPKAEPPRRRKAL